MTNTEKRAEVQKALKQAEAHAYAMCLSFAIAQATVCRLEDELEVLPLDDRGPDR